MADQPNDKIQATLSFENGKSSKGIVVNMTNRGFVLVCDSLRAPGEALGCRVTLHLSGEGLNHAQEAPGHIQGLRTEDSGHHRVAVWMDDIDDLNRLVEAGVAASFNRRGAYRVNPSADAPVAVSLTSEDGNWTHEDSVANMSASGIGVMVDASTAERFQESDAWTLSLQLPNGSSPMTFMSHVRRVIEKADGHLVGLDFDPVHTQNFDDHTDLVINYIMRRQRELLREQRIE